MSMKLSHHRLSCSRTSKQYRATPFQKDVWAQNEFEDIGPPPPYIEYLDAGGLTGAGSNLVCNCVTNSSRSMRTLESKATLRSRKARTSVKRLIRPVAKMFKGSNKQLDHSPANLPPMWNETGPEEPPRESGAWYHEMPAERTLCELPGNSDSTWTWSNYNNLNELHGEASVDGRLRSELEGQTSWPLCAPLVPAEENNDCSPISPMTHDLLRPISHFMLSEQVHPPVSPQSSVSPHGFRANYGTTQMERQSMTSPDFENLRNRFEPVELDAGFNACRETRNRKSSQAGSVANKSFQSWYRFSERRLRGGSWKGSGMNNPVHLPIPSPAQLGHQRGYFEDRRRAEQHFELKETSRGILNDDGELAVLWESPVIQEPLIGMVESIMHQLQPQGAKVLRGLGEGAEKITGRWNDALRRQWNGRGNFSEKDLPFFLQGWLSTKRTFSDHDLSTVEQRGAGQVVCSSPVNPVDGEIDMPYQHIDAHQKNIELPMASSPVSPTQTDSSSIASWATCSFNSPPLMNR